MKLPENFDYSAARAELDELLAWFETGEVNVDVAMQKYERADELLKQIDAYLADAKAKITIKIKKST